MTTELTDLEITAVALVDNPANPFATVELFKAMADHPMVGDADGMCADCGRPADQHPTMKADAPQITKEAPVADNTTEELVARVAELETERQALTTMTIEDIAALRGDDLTKFAKAAVPEPEDIWKGVPDDVRKRLEDAETRVAKMEADSRRATFIAKAADYEHVAGKDELGPALEQIDRLAPEAAPVLERALKAAEARITESGLFAEFGASGDVAVDDSPKAKAEALIKALTDEGVARAEAVSKVFTAHPDLYEPAK